MKSDGKTRQQVETTFKTPYAQTGCWLCHLKNPRHDLTHSDSDCLILKSIFSYSSSHSYSVVPQTKYTSNLQSATSVCRAHTAHTAPEHIPSTDKCCYDSGTWPLSLCSDIRYFTDIVYFDTPKYVELAECRKLGKELRQGLIDMIINNQY